MHHKFVIFPFTAIVNQELMKKALLVNAIDPGIGGVLIKGDKGTGKSTAVRSLAKLLPTIKVVQDCPFNCHPENLKLMCASCQERYERDGKLPWTERTMEVIDMPLSATEDMVVGTIDIKRVLRDGVKALEPGILARANRNILYIDEVNLLDDHLVNILLDSAAMGVNVVEREGISLYHPARFILVGTMNPEEGDLRPQIIDRFGLSVDVMALASKEERLNVMEYRMSFDADPWGFEERFSEAQNHLSKNIVNAQGSLLAIRLSRELLEQIVAVTTALGIKTHRADITMEKTSRALAVLDGRMSVTEDDIREAALLALQHRMKQLPFEKGGSLNRETIERILHTQKKEKIYDFDKSEDVKKNFLKCDAFSPSPGAVSAGTAGDRGLYVRARQSNDPREIAVDATIRKAVKETGALQIGTEHLMEKVRAGKGELLYIIALDSSSSMRMDRKIRLAKTLSWNVLKQSYEKRSKVALIAFRNQEAEIAVAPTSDAVRLHDALEQLPTGGKTPLTSALAKGFELAQKTPSVFATIILISDGRANVFIRSTLEEDIRHLSGIKPNNAGCIFIDTEQKQRSIGILQEMSGAVNGQFYYLEDIVIV